MVVCADCIGDSARRIPWGSSNNPASVLMRHVDAGYESAKAGARKN